MSKRSMKIFLSVAVMIGLGIQAQRSISNGQLKRALQAMSSAVWGT